MTVAGYIASAIALVCWFNAREEPPLTKTVTRLIGFSVGGLALLMGGLTLTLPPYLSPLDTVVGPVEQFRQVRKYRSSYFEFVVLDGSGRRPVLHADYFDKGFYFGDPVIHNGITVTATYLTWTRQVAHIAVLSGSNKGWSFTDDLSPVGGVLLIAVGITLMAGGLFSTISDRMAKSQEPEKATHDCSESGLKL